MILFWYYRRLGMRIYLWYPTFFYLPDSHHTRSHWEWMFSYHNKDFEMSFIDHSRSYGTEDVLLFISILITKKTILAVWQGLSKTVLIFVSSWIKITFDYVVLFKKKLFQSRWSCKEWNFNQSVSSPVQCWKSHTFYSWHTSTETVCFRSTISYKPTHLVFNEPHTKNSLSPVNTMNYSNQVSSFLTLVKTVHLHFSCCVKHDLLCFRQNLLHQVVS